MYLITDLAVCMKYYTLKHDFPFFLQVVVTPHNVVAKLVPVG